MNVLAIDTTLGACSAALYKSGEIHHLRELMERGHAEKIMPMIEKLRADANIEFSKINRIAVTSGPGTFTGVRIGIAAARGLALALGCEMFHETSLRIIALKALKELESEMSKHFLTVAMDARRGEVYLQSFDRDGLPINEPAAVTPVEALVVIEEHAQKTGETSTVIGSALNILKDAGLDPRHKLAIDMQGIQPDARELAELAANATELSKHVSPLYLRAPDAKPQIGKSVLRAG